MISKPVALLAATQNNEHSTNSKFLICEFGKSNFEVSVLQKVDYKYNLIVSESDDTLDFVDVVAKNICNTKGSIAPIWADRIIKNFIEYAEDLSLFYVEINDEEITFDEVNEWIKPLVEKSINITNAVLNSNEVQALGNIDKIILTGVGSRIPLVKTMLSEALSRADIECPGEDILDILTLSSKGAATIAKDILARKIQYSTSIGIALGLYELV